MVAAAAATLVFAIPFRLFGFSLPEPVFPVALAFAWAVIRPSVLGPFALLLIGLFLDLFWGGPVGLWSLALILAYTLALFARSLMVGQSAAILFGWYLTTAGGAFGCAYFFTLLDAKLSPNALAVLWQFLITTALFPLSYMLIERFEDADVRFR